jgi:hypothetical protein
MISCLYAAGEPALMTAYEAVTASNYLYYESASTAYQVLYDVSTGLYVNRWGVISCPSSITEDGRALQYGGPQS